VEGLRWAGGKVTGGGYVILDVSLSFVPLHARTITSPIIKGTTPSIALISNTITPESIRITPNAIPIILAALISPSNFKPASLQILNMRTL